MTAKRSQFSQSTHRSFEQRHGEREPQDRTAGVIEHDREDRARGTIEQTGHHNAGQTRTKNVEGNVAGGEPEDRQVKDTGRESQPDDTDDLVHGCPDQAHREQAEDDSRRSQHVHGCRALHHELHGGAFAHAEPEIHQQERPPAQLSLDDQAKGPEEQHVAGELKKAGVHEDVCHPLERVQAVAQDQGPLFVVSDRETSRTRAR